MASITTTSTRSTAQIQPQIRFDIEYLKTFHGMLKAAALILGIVNVISINVSSVWSGAANLFIITLSVAWSYTLTMLLFFLFHIPEKFYTLPWLPVEIGVTSFVALMYFISSLMVILVNSAAHTVAGIFGFITMCVYGYAGYLKFMVWKNGGLAQGSLTSRTTTTVTQQASAYPA